MKQEKNGRIDSEKTQKNSCTYLNVSCRALLGFVL